MIRNPSGKAPPGVTMCVTFTFLSWHKICESGMKYVRGNVGWRRKFLACALTLSSVSVTVFVFSFHPREYNRTKEIIWRLQSFWIASRNPATVWALAVVSLDTLPASVFRSMAYRSSYIFRCWFESGSAPWLMLFFSKTVTWCLSSTWWSCQGCHLWLWSSKYHDTLTTSYLCLLCHCNIHWWAL